METLQPGNTAAPNAESGDSGELEASMGASAPVSPIKLPAWLKESVVLDKIKKVETEFITWFKDELGRIEDKYKLLENKQGAGIKGPDGPVIPLVYSTVETLKATMMGADFAQQKLADLLPEGQESLKKAPLVPNPAYIPAELIPPPPVDPNTPPPPGMPPLPKPPEPQPEFIPDPKFKSAADIASIMEDFLGEAVYDTPDYFQKKDNLFQNLIIENMMIARLKWEEYDSYDLATERQPDMMHNMVTTKAGFEKRTKGCPNFLPRSIRNMGWDPRCQYNFRQASWLRDRSMVTKEELEDFQAKGIITNVDKIETDSQIDNANQSIMTDPVRDPQARQSKNVEGVNLPVGNTSGVLIQLDEYWAEFSGKDEEGNYQSVDLKLWVANGKTILMAEPNDESFTFLKRPFAVGVINQRSGQVSGLGPIDEILALVRKIANTNDAIDKLMWQTANAITFYEPVSMLDGKRTMLEGHTLVPTLSSKNINRFPPPSEAIAVLTNRLNFLINQVREATAANDQAQGISGESGKNTATEAKILAASSGKRLQYMINMVNSTFSTQVVEGYLELYRQAGLEGDMVTREAGVDGEPIPITYDMLEMRFKIRPVSAIPQSQKISRFNQLQNLLTGLLKLPPGTLKNDKGQPMEVNSYDFLSQDMLPLIDIRAGQRLFRVVDSPMGMPAPMGGQAIGVAPPPPVMDAA